LRIAVLVDTFPAASETFIARQVEGLLDLGHRVRIYSEHRPGEGVPLAHGEPGRDQERLLRRTTYLDIPAASGYWEMPVLSPWGRTWLPGATRAVPNAKRLIAAMPALARCLVRAPRITARVLNRAEYGYQASSLSALYRLDALSARRGYDVAHAHFGPVADRVRFARRLWKVPLVVSFHGYDLGAWPAEKGPDVYSSLFQTADLVTANSSYTRGRLLALGCPLAKVRVLHMGVDPSSYPFRERTSPQEGPVQVLSVGRLVEKKGFEYALRAMSLARCGPAAPDVRYAIVGEGPLRQELRTLAESLGVADRVTFYGVGDEQFVRDRMSEAHIFMAPSVTAANGDVEGQGLVLQEAQACGLPVLATEHNGFPEGIVPGRSGFLVPERDPVALARRLLFMVEHAHLWPEWGRAGRLHVEENYDIAALSRQLEGLYGEAIFRYQARAERQREKGR
jgi:colanic acid/amylovoran biosynthesis glycosyltransferase